MAVVFKLQGWRMLKVLGCEPALGSGAGTFRVWGLPGPPKYVK